MYMVQVYLGVPHVNEPAAYVINVHYIRQQITERG